MDNDQATQCTQGVLDPRRMGRNNSGLSEADISDVMCILHPCSPAAFNIVATTAERFPQNVLQNDGYANYDYGVGQSVLEEQETFILASDGPNHAMDLALRFSATPINPNLGFVFGRNEKMCDIVLATDTYKRVSNIHFSVFMNHSGVLMLRDMSTNGTMVDEVLLKGKATREPQTRMLNPGSIIQILSTKQEEIVKFIVRIPSREGHLKQYEARFQEYTARVALAQAKTEYDELARRLAPAQRPAGPRTHSIQAPLVHNQYGMHWSGGENYNVVGLIGKGAFATVYQLATKSEGMLFAAKELEKRKFMKNGVLDRKLDNEMQIMKAISHPNIVRYIDYQDHANHLYIIMEFVPCGDLQQYLSTNGSLSEALGKTVARQVLDSLAYLHAKKITHRDIKPDNILIANLDPNGFFVKLSDFGLSKVVQDNDTFLKTFCGTLLYCAPEVFPHYDAHLAGRGQKRTRTGTAHQASKFHSYSQSVDIWSFGAVLWYSLCGKPPFEGVADNTGRGMFDKIMMTPLDPVDLVRRGISDDAIALLVQMLNTDPSFRPSPMQCLHHVWFGLAAEMTAEGTADGLVSIAEEEEGDFGDEPDVSSLSLDEQGSNGSSQFDEASIHSGSMNFFDPRQSKRFKSDAFAYREHSELIDSSPELLHQSIPVMLQPDLARVTSPPPRQRKLFGEISQSDLNGHGVFGVHASDPGPEHVPIDAVNGKAQRHGSRDSAKEPHHETAREVVASPSLLGAESLLRDVHMESPEGSYSLLATGQNEQDTPRKSNKEHTATRTNGASKVHDDDATPKQPAQAVFSRQIKEFPIPASFFFDPNDPATHTLDYASRVSGHDFKTNPSMIAKDAETSLPATMSGPASESEHSHRDDTDGELESEVPTLLPPPSEFLKPPPRLGRLVTTPDSFTSLVLNLSTRMTSWGRAPSNTIPYHDMSDTRVPKTGIVIYFHAKGIEKLPEHADWTKMPDLHCGICTYSSLGLWINGVHLAKAEPGKTAFGRVYTGDKITVSRKGKDGHHGLTFTCEFYHGEGKEVRPKSEPRFLVESDRSTERLNATGTEEERVVRTDATDLAAVA